jgi:hypothetical protein
MVWPVNWPAPIFAGLATATLLTGDRSVVGGPIVCAALGALLVSPTRSLLFCLIGGAAGYALGALLSQGFRPFAVWMPPKVRKTTAAARHALSCMQTSVNGSSTADRDEAGPEGGPRPRRAMTENVLY